MSEPLVVVVSPIAGRPDRYDARLKGTTDILCTSSQPFFDAARQLLAAGHSPETVITMVRPGSQTECLRATLGVAAKTRVVEGNRTGPKFAAWRPFSMPEKEVPSSVPVAPRMRQTGEEAAWLGSAASAGF